MISSMISVGRWMVGLLKGFEGEGWAGTEGRGGGAGAGACAGMLILSWWMFFESFLFPFCFCFRSAIRADRRILDDLGWPWMCFWRQ